MLTQHFLYKMVKLIFEKQTNLKSRIPAYFFLSLFAKQIRKAFLHLVVQKALLEINKFVTKAFLNKKPMKNIMKNYLLLRLYIKIQ